MTTRNSLADGVANEVRAAQGQHGQRRRSNCSMQQPIVAEPLERGVGLRVRQEFLPEQRAGNQLDHPFALEQIERDHHRQSGGEPKCGWPEEFHGEDTLATPMPNGDWKVNFRAPSTRLFRAKPPAMSHQSPFLGEFRDWG